MTVTSFCNLCDKNVNAKIKERPANYTFKGESFDITEKVLICPCGEELYDEELDSATMNKLKSLYEERIGLPLSDIKNIRSQYNLSMEDFSRVLGWSKSTIARYETGKYIPNSTHLFVLKKLKNTPEEIIEHFQTNQNKFTDEERTKVYNKIKNYDEDKVEKSLFNAITLNYKLEEKTVESGYKEFNLDKIINMILFFAEEGVKKTKLMKMLFYSDFLNYKRTLLSISGVPYQRRQFGPVPKDHSILISAIEKSDLINISEEERQEYTIIEVISNKHFDNTLFSDVEIGTMNYVNNYFKSYGSVAISEFSHLEKGWKETNDRNIISYEFADYLQLD